MTIHLKRNFGLDLARFIAISLVLISHFGHKMFDILGFWGVELFFGLSGYLIGNILWRSYQKAEVWNFRYIFNFWSRRWWRTLPNYYLFLFISLLLTITFHEKISFSEVFPYFFFIQYLFSHLSGFYTVSWSLCIEEAFYLIFPVLLLIFSRIRLNLNASFVATLITIFLTSLFIKIILLNTDQHSSMREITLARLDAIGSGVLTTYIFSGFFSIQKLKQIFLAIGLFLITIPVIISIAMHTPITDIKENIVYLITVPLGFSLCLPSLSDLKFPSKLPQFILNSITHISLYSYSIYLSHASIMWFVYNSLGNLRNNIAVNFSSKVISLILCILFSGILYHYFEVPFTQKRPKEV